MLTAPALIRSLEDGAPMRALKTPTPDLMARWIPFQAAASAQLEGGLDHRARLTLGRPERQASMLDRVGRTMAGLNFAAMDYLGMTAHPLVLQAQARGAGRHALTAAGSMALSGLTPPVLALERRLSDVTGHSDATVFPSGAQAGQVALATLLSKGDHAILDAHGHPSMRAGARLAGAAVHLFPPGCLDAVERRLVRLRRACPDAGILVGVPAIAATTSVIADLSGLSELCTRYRATLVVDVAHDFGSTGVSGQGIHEIQGMLGRTDVMIGSFSHVFGSNGGFVASSHPGFHLGLRLGRDGQAQGTGLSPLQAAVILEAMDVVFGPEGVQRRFRLLASALRLRNRLEQDGFELMGQPSPLVPMRIRGTLLARAMTAEASRQRVLVNLMESPLVPRNAPRWRLQLMASHGASDIDQLAEVAVSARDLLGPTHHRTAPVLLPTGFVGI